ncbi:MAG: prephenate dehydratase [Candidatus Nitrotoga sp.]|nr:prephenate dehydratase [Candidatus Nitrotoga sp.]MBP0116765.1 prephenate dehydratase [Candidatus Nitrotoga sp.]MBP0122923.1 prephenate dehydratase [Candidatus Nitrotoga sp.]MBP0125617.1 prephenate dehydratase [Candidatus Nitrotoga sp.]MDW7534927.1 prephenate dehydratase [Candidatus Nitrotoga sp.]
MTEELNYYREQIDLIDDDLLKLFNQRAALAKKIGGIKNEQTVLRPEREAQILQRMTSKNSGPLPSQSVTQLFTEVMSHSRALEAQLCVAYLGPSGTFSEGAVEKRFGHAVLSKSCASIDEVFRTVELGEANYGVVPVENSTEGAIGRTLDLLLQSQLRVCGEVTLPIHQCLMSLAADMPSIRRVYSHSQSLGQCQAWLNTNLPNAERVPVGSNTQAILMALEHKEDSAAIASEKASKNYSIPLLVKNIEDDQRNTTRFLIVGDQDVAPSGKDKTSLVMSAHNRPGAVHDLLAPFAKHGVSLTKLESRPARSGAWEYVFYLDIEGHQHESGVASALSELKQVAAFVKVLGSYPVGA